MKELRLARLISDGMILQREQECRIWGWDVPGRRVIVSFLDVDYEVVTDEKGQWKIELQKLMPGGPYSMRIRDEAEYEIEVHDILVGDVWFCSGQSNMELPMMRVKDAYPEEISTCENAFIRTFKIVECSDFHAPKEELLTGEWKEANKDNILDFSATAYFFAKAYFEMTKIPVGLVNATLGGSGIESWMGRDMLTGYDDFLSLADQYAEDAFIEKQKIKNEKQMLEWHQNLDTMDIGLKEGWEKKGTQWETTGEVSIPFFFKDTELKDFIGSVWFYRTFYVSNEMAKKAAHLWLGTIVDSDTVYVNGVETGHTDYQYPPRKYEIAQGILKEGENTIAIRVKCEKGMGRFTINKTYALWNEAGRIDLQGTWKCRIGAICAKSPETDFINWKPTGLYNGMTAPCHKYNIAGVLWYQGESNTHDPAPYADLFERMVTGYRNKWKNKQLPFYYVQLPNFEIDLHNSDPYETGSGWPEIRELQRLALQIPNTGMVTAIDLGEDNDLHPLNKKDIGYRLALLAVHGNGQKDLEYTGPMVESIQEQSFFSRQGCRVILSCSHAKEMYAFHPNKGNQIKDFELVDENGQIYPAEAVITGNKIIVCCKKISTPAKIRYCYKNTPSGGLIYNKNGLPMSPFIIEIE